MSEGTKFRFIDFFSGIGCFRMAFERAGAKCVYSVEIDKHKRRQYEIIFGYEPDATDIRDVCAGDIPAAECWCAGFPCLTAGTLITTSEGLVPIEDVKVGDYVLTHRNRFRKVTARMMNTKTGIYTLRTQGTIATECTGNHRFYVRYRTRKFNSKTRLYDSIWSEPEWKAIEDFTGDEFVQMPKNRESTNVHSLTEQECWLIGRYVADGYLQDYVRKGNHGRTRRTVFCIGIAKVDEFERHIHGYKMYKDDSSMSCRKYVTLDRRIFDLCSECKRGAEKKVIPRFIMDLPPELLMHFLDGYSSGDCSRDKQQTMNASTTSIKLAYQIGQIVMKVYGTPYQICKPKYKPIRTFREKGKPERIINQKQNYTVRFYEKVRKQAKAKYIDDNIWVPVSDLKFDPLRTETVYNLEIEEDESYTANNLGLHNCQDASIAGEKSGLAGDKTGLFFQLVRLLKELPEEDRPNYLLFENVRNLLSINKGFDFARILIELDNCGYDVQWQVIDSKYFVPQHRERIYIVGCLRAKRKSSEQVLPIEIPVGKDDIQVKQVMQRDRPGRENLNQYRVYDPTGIAPTLTTAGGGGRNPYVFRIYATDRQTDRQTDVYE
jgi:intein/homing endonuclease